MKRATYWFDLVHGGLVVASADGEDRDAVLSEAMHYLMQYGRDAPTELRGSIAKDVANAFSA